MPKEAALSRWTVELRSRSRHFFTWKGYATSKPAACKAARDAYGAAWAIMAGDVCGPPGAKAVCIVDLIKNGLRSWSVHEPMSDSIREHRVNGKPRRSADKGLCVKAIAAVLDSDPSTLRDGGCLRASGRSGLSQGGRSISVALTDDGNDEKVASQTTALCVLAAYFAMGDAVDRTDVGFEESPSATLRAARRFGRIARNLEDPGAAAGLMEELGAHDAAKAVLRQALATKKAHDDD